MVRAVNDDNSSGWPWEGSFVEMVRVQECPDVAVNGKGRAPSVHLIGCNTNVIMDWLEMRLMADWLCRLTSEEFAQGQWSAENARVFGVDAWVISVEAQAAIHPVAIA